MQTTFSRNSKPHFETLISQIREFGLNPQDWKISAKGRSARLIHRHDESFRFKGWIDTRKWTWRSLHLESL